MCTQSSNLLICEREFYSCRPVTTILSPVLQVAGIINKQRPLDESKRGEWKSKLKTQYSKN